MFSIAKQFGGSNILTTFSSQLSVRFEFLVRETPYARISILQEEFKSLGLVGICAEIRESLIRIRQKRIPWIRTTCIV